MTTNAAWIAEIQAMTVTGVTRRYTEPPLSLNTADLPASWPQPFGVEMTNIISSCSDLNKTRTCTYYIALEPTPQSTQAANYAAVIAMVDNLETAIAGIDVMEFVTYTIRSIIVQVGGTDYWALEATLTGSNFSGGGNQ
jgi:hypothetical protein